MYDTFPTAIHCDVAVVSGDGRRIECDAIIDTGAEETHISTEVALRLGQNPVRYSQMVSATDVHRCARYDVRLLIGDYAIPYELEVVESPLPCGIDVLVGMDVLGLGSFHIVQRNNKTIVKFVI